MSVQSLNAVFRDPTLFSVTVFLAMLTRTSAFASASIALA